MRMCRILAIVAMLAVTVFAVTDDVRVVPGEHFQVAGFFPMNGELYVSGNGLIKTSGLFKVLPDGTVGHITSISAGFTHNPSSFVRINDSFAFLHNDMRGPTPQWDSQLWLSDGTAAGTRKIMREHVRNLVYLKDWIYFVGDSLGLGPELWRMNERGELQLIKDIFPGAHGSNPHALTVYKDKLLFWAFDGLIGYEPYFFDPLTNQVSLLKDIHQTNYSCTPTPLNNCENAHAYHGDLNYHSAPVIWNGLLYFMSKITETGFEPFLTDGTTAGTRLFRDINPGPLDSHDPLIKQEWKVFNNELYFVADDGRTGMELWKIRATDGAPVLVKDIQPGSSGSLPRHMTEYKGYLYFQAYTGTYAQADSVGTELWRTDGTAQGTQLFYEFNKTPGNGWNYCGSDPEDFIVYNDKLYFSAAEYASSGVFTESIWSTDGTVAGTVRVKQLDGAFLDGGVGTNNMTIYNNELYFTTVNTLSNVIYKIVPPLPPSFASTPVTEAQVNELYTYEPIATDPNNDAITYSVVKMPSWMHWQSASNNRIALAGYPSAADVGNHQVIVRADANGATTQQAFSVTVTQGSIQRSMVVSLGGANDDAMEFQNGLCDPTLDRLELGNKIVALRFKLNLPADAIVQRANLQFTSSWQYSPRAISVQICGERSADAAALNDGLFDISRRIYSTYTGDGLRSGYKATAARVTWNIPLWNSNEAGAAQQSPNIAAVINELISQPGWKSGNEIVLCVLHDNFSKAGLRAASYEKDPAQAPQLLMEFTTGQELSKPLLVEYLGRNTPPQLIYGGFGEGAVQCNDRQPTAVFSDVPVALRGLSYLLTARDDKHGTDALTVYYQLELPVPMRVHALIDVRSGNTAPGWLAADGWTSSGQRLSGAGSPYLAYVKNFDAGGISLKRQTTNSSNGTSYLFEPLGATTPLTVTVNAYYADQIYPTIRQGLGNGALQVNDRSVALWDNVPEQLKGLSYLLTSRDDKYASQSENTALYRVGLSRSATVYCLIDNRAGDSNPAWLAADGWSATALTLTGENMPYAVYSKQCAAGFITLKREVGITTNGTSYAFK